MQSRELDKFKDRVADQTAMLGVMGLGYVGLPLAVEMARAGYTVIGYDVSNQVVAGIISGRSHVQDIDSEVVADLVAQGRLRATTDVARLGDCHAISICVPTPLNKIKDPDLSYVVAAAESVAMTLRPGQLVILESTTYPGTTREVVLPILERGGMKAGVDFFACFSPERVDPGNKRWNTRNTPKVIGGITPACTEAGLYLYGRIFDRMVPVTSAEAAELSKVYENTFRMINIALANELAQACNRLGIDVWEVIDAAATKPFGFMKFTPGPGLGGHCIPLDPHYLSWKMRMLSYKTRMIEVASEINAEMPDFVVQKVGDALNQERRPIKGSRVLVLGVAYKKDVDDQRESPALEIIHRLREKGAEVAYHDPHCPEVHWDGSGIQGGSPMYSVPLTREELKKRDCVLIVTDHSAVDYRLIAEQATLVVDCRGVMRGIPGQARVVGISGV